MTAKHGPAGPEYSRRRFLARAAGLAAAASLPWATAGAAPPATRGSARLDVREHGAKGDGTSNDTSALQAAIDALPEAGGTVHVPAGDYLVDAARSVHLRSAMRLELDPGARLVAIPNAIGRAYVLSAFALSDLEIVGGQIIGERDRHRGQGGEWGHGLAIRGCRRVRVQGLAVSRCWGDGISVGAEPRKGVPEASSDIVLANVSCRGNRRQGLTIGRAHRVQVVDSAFLDTGGTAPACGIDIEPDTESGARDIQIERCLIKGNRGGGIEVHRRASDVGITDCRIVDNGGYGLLFASAEDCRVVGTLLSGNAQRGLVVRKKARRIRVEDNRFLDNGPSKYQAKRWRHLDVASGADMISAAGNRFD